MADGRTGTRQPVHGLAEPGLFFKRAGDGFDAERFSGKKRDGFADAPDRAVPEIGESVGVFLVSDLLLRRGPVAAGAAHSQHGRKGRFARLDPFDELLEKCGRDDAVVGGVNHRFHVVAADHLSEGAAASVGPAHAFENYDLLLRGDACCV